jgi:hypothetical protein
MGWRYRKSFKLLPGVRINVSSRGVSTTIGGKALSVNVGPPSAISMVVATAASRRCLVPPDEPAERAVWSAEASLRFRIHVSNCRLVTRNVTLGSGR